VGCVGCVGCGKKHRPTINSKRGSKIMNKIRIQGSREVARSPYYYFIKEQRQAKAKRIGAIVLMTIILAFIFLGFLSMFTP